MDFLLPPVPGLDSNQGIPARDDPGGGLQIHGGVDGAGPLLQQRDGPEIEGAAGQVDTGGGPGNDLSHPSSRPR